MKKIISKRRTFLLNGLFLAGIILALFTERSFIFILWALPFVMFDRSFIIPLLMLIPLLEGAFNLDAATPIETILIAIYTPILLFDIYNYRNISIPRIYKNGFFLFIILICFGTIVALLSDLTTITSREILTGNIVKVIKLFFLMLYLYFLVGKGKDFILKGIKHLTFIMPIILIALFIYLEFYGISVRAVVNFGNTKHGIFTATLVSLSTYSLWYFFAKKSSIYYRLFTVFTMLLTIWIIMSSGSRNGLLSFIVMTTASIYFFIGFKLRLRNILIVAFLLISFTYYIFQNLDSTAIQRLQAVEYTSRGIEGSGIDRIYLWEGAILGFFDKPITGHGAHSEIVRSVERKKVKIDNVVHNAFLEFALQYGIFGILVYILLQYQIYKGARRIKISNLRDNRELSRLLIPFVSYISLFFSSMFLSWPWESIIWYNICLIFAISILFTSEKYVAT